VSFGEKILVLKRDGSREPFDLGKLRRAIAVAIRECEEDDSVADVLAQAVLTHLKSHWESPEPPSAPYLLRCCQTALHEAEMPEAARRMDLYARARINRRKTISVVDVSVPSAEPRPWRKRKLIRWFETRANVSRAMARMLAARIETYLFGLSYELVSTALITELSLAELYAWGLSDELFVAAGRGRDCGVTSGSGRTPDR
jgi:hypothetical protein